MPFDPGRDRRTMDSQSAIPAGIGHWFAVMVRWYRFAQPPAIFWDPFGIKTANVCLGRVLIPKGSQRIAGGRSEAKTPGSVALHLMRFDPGRDRRTMERVKPF
jgi:hypothetical protein